MADTLEDLRFVAGRLDDDDLRLDAVIRERQMLRSDSVDGRLPVARARRAVERQLDAGFGNEARPAVERNPSLDEVHRRRAYEPCHEQVGRMIVKLEWGADLLDLRSEEHTSELPSLMRISDAVFCLKKKEIQKQIRTQT